jgi:hypothetical protein
MSNYLSQEYRIVTPQSNVNIPLTDKVLNMRQGKYDANKALIDQTLATYADQLKGLRDIDNEYIATRLREVVDTVNQTGQVSDFSIGQNTDTILNSIRSVTKDPFVQSAVANRYAKAQYDNSYNEMCKKDPSKCNPINYEYGLYKAGFDKYMKGDLKDMGALNVTPYVDYMTNAIKKAKDLKDLKGDQEIETPIPGKEGAFMKRKISGLSVEEVMAYFPEILSSEEEQQMRIDGWAQLKDQTPDKIKQYANNYFSAKNEAINDRLTSLNATINGAGFTDEERNAAKQEKKVIEAKLKDLQLYQSNVSDTDPEQIGYLLKREEFMNTAKNMFAGRESITYDYDDYYKNLKLELDLRKENREQLEFEARMRKDYNKNPDGTEIKPEDFPTTPIENQKVEDRKSDYEATVEAYNTAYNDIINNVQAVYNDDVVPEENKAKFEKVLKINGFEVVNGAITKIKGWKGANVSKADAAQAAFTAAKFGIFAPQTEKIVIDATTTRENIVGVLGKADKAFIGKVSNEKLSNIATNAILSKTGRANLKLDEAINSFEDFLKRNGYVSYTYGTPKISSELEKRLSSDINFKRQYISYIENIDKNSNSDKFMNVVADRDVFENRDSIIKNANIKPYIQTDRYSVNIAKEDDRKALIGKIPSTVKDEEGNDIPTGVAMLDEKRPFTVEETRDGFKITQDRGVETSGNKKGQPLAPTVINVFKGSAAYNFIAERTGSKKTNEISLTTVPSNYKIKTDTKPYFIDADNDDIKNAHINRLKTNVNTGILNSISSAITPRNASVAISPEVFLTKESTVFYFKGLLQGTEYQDQVEGMVDRISKSFDKYNIAVKPNTNKTNWVTEFSSPFSDKTVVKNLTASQEISKDYIYLLKTMPQILILTEVAKELMKDPSKVNKI